MTDHVLEMYMRSQSLSFIIEMILTYMTSTYWIDSIQRSC